MKRLSTVLIVFALALGVPVVQADAPIATAVGLSMDQARQASEIQARYRKEFAKQRGEYTKVARHARAARVAHDAEKMARLEAEAEVLRQGLVDIRQREHAELRALLTPAQVPAFEAWLAENRQMHGSSRDERLLHD